MTKKGINKKASIERLVLFLLRAEQLVFDPLHSRY
jgi:hypothetical protein